VVVVGETFAKHAFPGDDPVGRRIEWNDDTWEIVGVTTDVRHAALSDLLDADVYVPRAQVVRDNTWLLLKTYTSDLLFQPDIPEADLPRTVLLDL
ncbi:MAG TPA: ABC transporter permease, partial [Vicinamibacterales bacterium]|nr:ABC transporter permease [Vicinamibacterales bacterium]